MDQNLVYAKTSTGDDAVRQRTRVVQRNLRMVLVQVDGKTSVGELAAKVGNPKLVESALRELEDGGFITSVSVADSVWEQGKKVARGIKAAATSQFSSFGGKSVPSSAQSVSALSQQSAFSDFDDPLVPEDKPARPQPARRPARREAPVQSPAPEASAARPGPRRFRPILALWLVVGLLALAGLGLVFYPYERLKPELEAALAGALQAPVRVGALSLGLLPRPSLTLRNVDIGSRGESHADEIRLYSPWALLRKTRPAVPEADISGLTMPAEGLALLVGHGAAGLSEAAPYALGHVGLKRVGLRLGEIAIGGLEGEILFKTGGKLEKLVLQSEDRSLRVEAFPAAQGVGLNIEALAWKPLEGAPFAFDSLQAKGLLQGGKMVLRDIDSRVLGGLAKGNLLLDWNHGLAMAGEFGLTRLSMRKVAEVFAPALKMEGDLSGSLKIRGSGRDWQAMASKIEASLDADIARGALIGIDLGEAARRGAGSEARGGATHFDRLRGLLQVEPNRLAGSNVRMEAGLVTAAGHFVGSRDGKVEGRFEVDIRSSVGGLQIPVRLSGSVPDLVLTAGR